MSKIIKTAILVILAVFLADSSWSAPTSVTSKIGKEDLKYWDGGTRSFNRRTSTGGNLALVPIDVAGAVDVYQTYSARTGATLKSADLALGTDNGTLYLDIGTWSITDDLSLTNHLLIPKGAVLNVASGKTLTISSPYKIVAQPDQEVFTGPGTVTFTNQGTIYADWWGPAKDGTTDDYADLNATITSAPSGSTVVLGTGIHLSQSELVIKTGINLVGNCATYADDQTNASTIKAGASNTGTMLTWWPYVSVAGQHKIECIKLDGNDVANIGLEIKNSTGLTVERVTATDFNSRAYYVNGHDQCGYDCPLVVDGYGYISNVKFESCDARYSKIGYAIERHGTPVFGVVTLDNCNAYYTETGLLAKGDNETNGSAPPYYNVRVIYDGGHVEIGHKDATASPTDVECVGIKAKDGAFVDFRGNYIENYPSYCTATTDSTYGSFNFWASYNSRILNKGGNTRLPLAYNYAEDNSTICQGLTADTGGTGFGYIRYSGLNDYCIGKTWDKKTWGSPAFPTGGKDGRHGYPGEEIVDVYGTRWRQVEKTKASPYDARAWGSELHDNARWAPKDRIIIPFTAATLNAGNAFLWWSESKYVVTDFQIVVVDAFSVTGDGACAGLGGYSGIRVGNDDDYDLIIKGGQSTQATPANLAIAGKVIRAWDNNGTTAAVTTSKGYYMDGNDTSHVADYANHDTAYLGLYPCPSGATGTWSNGTGYFVIHGYSLEY